MYGIVLYCICNVLICRYVIFCLNFCEKTEVPVSVISVTSLS
jgi:hypothetical protein